MADKNDDPYSFLPTNLDQGTASKLLRSRPDIQTSVPIAAPDTPEEFEAFVNNTQYKKGRTLTFGPNGLIEEESEVKEQPQEPLGPEPTEYSAITEKIEHTSSMEFFKEPEQINPNPLSSYYRTPELFVRIPSQGKFNKPEDFAFTVDGQLGIYPMTAKDEVILRTPDALLNGAALEQILKSCVPGVKNVRDLPSPDFDLLMLAIRAVSVDPQLDYDTKCPKCSTTNSFGIDINNVLDSVKPIKGPKTIKLKSGVTLTVHPYTFDATVKAALIAFEEAQLVRAVSQQDVPEEEKLLQFNESLDRIAKLNVDLFAGSIAKVVTPKGDTVTDKSHIRDFIQNISKNDFDQIEEAIKAINLEGFIRTSKVICNNDACKHEYDIDINYDPTRFFGKGF